MQCMDGARHSCPDVKYKSAVRMCAHIMADEWRRRAAIAAHGVGLALALAVMATGSVMAARRKRHYCLTFMEKPMVGLGAALAAAAGAGLAATWWGRRAARFVHVVALFVLGLVLLSFAILSVDMTNGGGGGGGGGIREFNLSGYPKWMQRRVEKKREWKEVERCLQSNGFCSPSRLPYNGPDFNLFRASSPSPIQSGCCKPPLECNFGYIDATHWNSNPNSMVNIDCQIWDNNPSILCYRCSSCKAGVIQATKDRWSKTGVVLLIASIIIVVVYIILGSIIILHERKYDA